MENKIDIIEILKDCKDNPDLYSPLFGECFLLEIEEDKFIKVMAKNSIYESELEFLFYRYGNFCYIGKECLLFPSKDYRSWEGVKVENGKLVIPEVTSKSKFNKFYCFGSLERCEILREEFEKLSVSKVSCYYFSEPDTIIYIDNLGLINKTRNTYEHNLISQGYQKLELKLFYQPTDKELVWCFFNGQFAKRSLGFYDEKNHCIFASDGKRCGDIYSNYAPYEGVYPEWAREALRYLED